jgi:uncharacterized protein YjiS (DUF1127 family)
MTSHAEAFKSAAEPFGRTIAAAVALVMTRIRRLAVAFKHRRDAAVLATFDDRMLADIGLTRSDLREAFSEPLWRDPTALLVNRIGRRGPRVLPAPSIVPEVARVRVLGRRY